MAKNPAFLFYPGDWLGGTHGMSFEEKGAYIDLLIMQFNRGHMTEHMIRQTVGQLWDTLSDKFIKDDTGKFYNERLNDEKIKRNMYVESRSNNKTGKNQHSKTGHMTTHMSNHMDNVNDNVNKEVNKEKKNEVFSDPVLWTSVVKNFYKDFRWQEKFCRDKNINPSDLSLKQTEFISDLELKEDFKDLTELKRHFTNWFNKNKEFTKPALKFNTSTAPPLKSL